MPTTRPGSRATKALRVALLVAASFLTGCSSIPEGALALNKDSLKHRVLQTRKYETTDEKSLLSASVAVLQDLGFILDESEAALGVLVGSKTRDATDGLQIAGAVLLAALSGVMPAVDDRQKIKASLVTRPSKEEGSSLVRVTFQHVVWDTYKEISKIEAVNDPEVYQAFFSRLDKAVFLEGQKI